MTVYLFICSSVCANMISLLASLKSKMWLKKKKKKKNHIWKTVTCNRFAFAGACFLHIHIRFNLSSKTEELLLLSACVYLDLALYNKLHSANTFHCIQVQMWDRTLCVLRWNCKQCQISSSVTCTVSFFVAWMQIAFKSAKLCICKGQNWLKTGHLFKWETS